ncbi:MAG: hypothetical protein K2X35_23730 [Bryobacteraceae bacterium]|nr:hypothetical protein [Bryobacteraceae bacterium]
MGARNILMVRLSAMGDIVHAMPAAATLRHSFPDSRLTWVVKTKWAPLLEANPFVDEILPFERTGLAGWRDLRRRLRSRRFDLAFDFQGLLQSAIIASMARPERIYGPDRPRELPARLFYSTAVSVKSAHVVDQNLEVAQAGGASNVVRAFPLPPGHPEGDLPSGRFVLGCPLAGWTSKQWPLDRWSELARTLRDSLGIPLVVNGPPEAESRLRPVDGAVVHLSGLAGLLHASRQACAVVGVDSGPLHIAAALSKPGVAIFGPTDPARNGPYGGTIRVLRDPAARTSYQRGGQEEPSMRAILSADVFRELERQLSSLRAGSPA